nr:unnamed protein product [Callosobruchus chinensis]
MRSEILIRHSTPDFIFQIPERSQKYIPPSETHNSVPSVNSRRTPLVTFSKLELEVDTETFHNGKARLSCVASIFHLYKREKDVILEEERPRPRPSSVLGIRDVMGGRQPTYYQYYIMYSCN